MEKSPFEDVGVPQVVQIRPRRFIGRITLRNKINGFSNQFVGNPNGTFEWVFASSNAVKFTTRKAAEVALAACLLSS